MRLSKLGPFVVAVRSFARLAVAPVALTALGLATFGAPAIGCKGSGKGADDPISMGGTKVRVLAETREGCQKIGTVNGMGRDGNEGLAEQQANDAAREQAAQLGGDALIFVDNKEEKEAGSGGPVLKITKTAEVYNCPADVATPASS